MSEHIIVNFDLKQYLRPATFGENADVKSIVDSHEGVLLGLTILLADGNNRGGGDLRSDAPVVGSWAGCRIAIVDEFVKDEALSEPGLADTPLQEQMLRLGTDVSSEVIAAIVESERGYCDLSILNPNLVFSEIVQRQLPGIAMSFFKTELSRTTLELQRLEHLYWIFGVSSALGTSRAKSQLEKGLQKMAQLFGRPEHYVVNEISFEHGYKQLVNPHNTRERARAKGVILLAATLQDTANPEAPPIALEVHFGLDRGSTLAKVYEQVFPGIVFERPVENKLGITSPAVAKLLSFLDKKED